MPLNFTFKGCVVGTTVLMLCTPDMAQSAKWPPKIRIKPPKVTISPPKIEVPTPATVVKNVVTATTVAVQQGGNVAGNVVTATNVAVQQGGNVAGNVVKEGGVAIHNIGKAIGQGGHDVVAETGRVPGHAVEAGNALIAYTASYGNSALDAAAAAKRRLSQGKIVDAFFHIAIAPLEASEEAAFVATQKSGWVNSAGAVAASAYGGPGGSAAYAAWQTYRLTNNNLELAIRAGIIAGLTKAATGGVSDMDVAQASDLIKKAALAGAIGGASIAASGGDESAVLSGIAMGGGMVLVQDAYADYVGHKLDAKGAKGPPYCMSPGDPDCAELRKAFTYNEATKEWKYDPKVLDPTRSHVGVQANVGSIDKPLIPSSEVTWKLDRSWQMQAGAQVPAFNAMGLFHDKWAVDWNMGTAATMATIIPAVAITYVGAGAPLFTEIPKQIVESQKAEPTEVKPDAKVKELTGTRISNGATKSLTVLEPNQVRVDAFADSLAATTKGIESLGEGIVKPASGWAWANPSDSAKYNVQRIQGIESPKGGVVSPAPGWEWAKPEDPLSMDVKQIVGVEMDSHGKLRPVSGCKWADPKDPKNFKVIAKRLKRQFPRF